MRHSLWLVRLAWWQYNILLEMYFNASWVRILVGPLFHQFKSLFLLLRRHLHPRSLKCVGIFCIKWRQINSVLRIFRLHIRKSRPNLESESKYMHTLNPNLYFSWKTQISDLNPNIYIHRIRISNTNLKKILEPCRIQEGGGVQRKEYKSLTSVLQNSVCL